MKVSLRFECEVSASLERVWSFHDDVRTLFLLTPPSTTIKLATEPEPMHEGVVYIMKLKRWGIVPLPTWHARIRTYQPPSRFVDEQIPGKGPFKHWQHEHRFEAIDDSHARIIDSVEYEPPFGPIGAFVNWIFIRRDVEAMFAYRHAVTKRELEK